MTLSLPIVVGKKYVRRDGETVEAKAVPSRTFFAWITDVEPDWQDYRSYEPVCVYSSTGRISHRPDGIEDNDFDLVSDYIEPAKGHPHADKMAEFAEDAKETATPWDRWEMQDCNGDWLEMSFPPEWSITAQYRRRPAPTPDPHAESAAEYAKDMAVSDKAWEGWEKRYLCCPRDTGQWLSFRGHPDWNPDFAFRRKEQS